MKIAPFQAQLKSAGLLAWQAGAKADPKVMIELYDGTKLAVEGVSFEDGNIVIKLGDGDG